MANITSATIVAAIITATSSVISAIGGAYANNYFSKLSASEQTIAGTSTLVGISQEAIDIAKSQKVAPEIIQRLDQIKDQARAVEASAKLLQKPAGVVSNQVDFWLRLDSGATLGETTSFGVTDRYSSGRINVVVNNEVEKKEPGGRVDFKTKSGELCFVTYIGTSPDNRLFGFKVHCGVESPDAE